MRLLDLFCGGVVMFTFDVDNTYVDVFRDGDWYRIPIYRLDEWLDEGDE